MAVAVSLRLESGTIQMPSAAMLADATILAPLSFQEISAGARINTRLTGPLKQFLYTPLLYHCRSFTVFDIPALDESPALINSLFFLL